MRFAEEYLKFDKEFGQIVTEAFTQHRIDAKPRKTKRSGAFCASFFDGKTSFILQSFDDTIDNAQTTAHELGHYIHNAMMVKRLTPQNMQIPNVLAEAAGQFCSMLFTDVFLKRAATELEKKAILFRALESTFSIIFEVGSRFRFEEKLYQAIERKEYLDAEKINTLFWEARHIYFGDAINWLPEQVYQWPWKPHYYIASYRFYNYPYIFSELLALVLYNQYKTQGTAFIPKLKGFLEAGSAKSPADILAGMDFDISAKSFWQAGFEEIKRLLAEIKALL